MTLVLTPRCFSWASTLGRGLLTVVLALIGGLWAADLTAHGQDPKPALAAFTANWCASCRDIIPLAADIAQQNGVTITIIDVDDPQAPKRAKALGLAIPTRDLPQVFVMRGGQGQLILDGAAVRYGQSEAARARLLRGLQAPQ